MLSGRAFLSYAFHFLDAKILVIPTDCMFSEEKPTAFLAEHVWEHMTFEEGVIAAKNCHDFLASDGYLRVAVPDRNFRNEWYQNMVQVGGNGDPNHPAFTHKIVYDYKTLSEVFTPCRLCGGAVGILR